MPISKNEFIKLDLNSKFELLSNDGLFVGNRLYYNHRVNLYSINKFFVEVHYEPTINRIDRIEPISLDLVIKAYSNLIDLIY